MTAPTRYVADELRPGAVIGPEANRGEGGTIAYVCNGLARCTCEGDDDAGHDDECEATVAEDELAHRIADALNLAAAHDAMLAALEGAIGETDHDFGGTIGMDAPDGCSATCIRCKAEQAIAEAEVES